MKIYNFCSRGSIPLLAFLAFFIAGTLQSLAVPSISLSTPTSNADWCRGAYYNIIWSSSEINNVKIELSSDGGTTYPTVLVASTPATTGTWSWLVPTEQSFGTQYKIRVSDVSTASVNAESATFNVRPPAVITSHPQSWSNPVCDGEPVTVSFSVSAEGHGLRYQWKRNGSNVSGATAPTYTIRNPRTYQAGNYSVVVTGSCGEVESNAAALVVYSRTELGAYTDDPQANPTEQIVCAGSPATFSIRARGTNLTYQWRKNGIPVTGATTATYTIVSPVLAHAGNYDVVVSGACGSATSKTAQLVIDPTTAINKQPEAQTVCAGTAVTFTVEAVGANLAYQWRRNGTNINGATNPQYAIGNPTVSGNYDVVVRGCNNSVVTSNSVALTVNQITAITKQPVATKVCSGMPVTLEAQAVGTKLLYQWYKDEVAIRGATQAQYTVPNSTTAHAGEYSVKVRGTCGEETSETVMVTVFPTTVITQQPLALTVCEDTPATFSVGATGTNLTYQWRHNGVAIIGATQAQYTTTSTRVADAGEYDVVIAIASSSCGTIVSKPVALTVNERPKITEALGNYTVCLGEAVTISVHATGKDITYQWRKNGTAIKGATESSYTISSVRQEDLGKYDVFVQGLCAPAIASTLAEVKLAETPVFTVQPVSQTVCEDASVTLHAAATYAAQYIWYKNGAVIQGAADERYTLSSVDARAEGEYTCVVVGRCNQKVTSAVARLSVTPKPIIRQQPTSVTTKLDEPIVLRVVATGDNLTYQWRKNGAPIAGATQTQFSIEKAEKSDAGMYSVAVRSECTTVVSAAAFVTVTTGTAQAPVFTLSSVQLIYGTVDIDKQSELNATASNTGGGSITVTEIVIEGANATEFNVVDMPTLPQVLTAGSTSLALRVAFKPTTEGEKKATVVLKSSGVNLGTIQLSGSGRKVNNGSPKLTSTSGENINFGILELPTNASKRMEVKIQNTGTALAKVTEALLSGAQAQAFSVVSVTPSLPTDLQPNAELTVVVEYKPTTTGTAKAELSVKAEGISTPLVIQLTGEAKQQTVSVGETNIATVFAIAPNPVTDMAVIRFALQQPSASVHISIVDEFGRQVRHLGVFNAPIGEQRVQWDARDDSGRPCASGTYRVVLSSNVSLQSLPLFIVR